MDRVSVSAIRVNGFILYRYDLLPDIVSDFLKSKDEYLICDQTYRGNIFFDSKTIVLQEWDKYKVKSINNDFRFEDFYGRGEYGDSGFGVLQFKNSLGYSKFRGALLLVESLKISITELNKLVDTVNNYISNLSYDYNQSTAASITRSISRKTDLNYHVYLLLHKAFTTENKLNNIFNSFKLVESNPNRLFRPIDRYEDINTIVNISEDSIIDLYSGGVSLKKTTKDLPLSARLSRGKTKYLPKELYIEDAIDTYNNPENQFVKFFFEWSKGVITHFQELFLSTPDFKSQNYITDNTQIIKRINSLLRQSFLSKVDSLSTIPVSSTVLTQRAGYRQIYKTFIGIKSLPERNESLNVKELIDNKNIDVLYENYCFFMVADIIARLYSQKINKIKFKVSKTESTKVLRKQTNSNYFEFIENGLYPTIRLHYNKNYSVESYSKPYDPDISIEIYKNNQLCAIYMFDAKFRASIRDIVENPEEEKIITKTYKYDDISKMHTYRDAIIKAQGAFVLYPGTKKEIFYYNDSEKDLLNGVGAFPLNPGNDQDIQSLSTAISNFLSLNK